MGCAAAREKEVTEKEFTLKYDLDKGINSLLDEAIPEMERCCKRIEEVRKDVFEVKVEIGKATSQMNQSDPLYDRLIKAIKGFWESNQNEDQTNMTYNQDDIKTKIQCKTVRESDKATWACIEKYQTSLPRAI